MPANKPFSTEIWIRISRSTKLSPNKKLTHPFKVEVNDQVLEDFKPLLAFFLEVLVHFVELLPGEIFDPVFEDKRFNKF